MNTDPLRFVYLARQPIVDARMNLVGFELLFRSADASQANVEDNAYATSTVIANAFTEIGLDQVLGDVDGYINVDAEFLFSDLIEALPVERIVLELLETTIADDRIVERVRELRRMGYRVAIDDFVGNHSELDGLLPSVDIVKVDFERMDAMLAPMIVGMIAKHDVRLIATKVESREQFAQACGLGFQLFQGYHFARPEILTAKRAKPSKLALMRLLSLTLGDAETSEIEAELKRHPTVSVNLLRLANSAAMARRQPVTSLRHALMLIGRRQLRIWLYLLLYTADRGGKPFSNPLLQLAAVRGKLMELVAARRPGPDSSMKDIAFITGILSLMDVVMETPLAAMLTELNVPEVMRAALIERTGEIGHMLNLVEALERSDPAGVKAAAAAPPGLDVIGIAPLQLQAFQWATEITSPAQVAT